MNSDKEIKIMYDDENVFKRYLKSLKKYNMLGYKEFCFKILTQLKEGQTPGVLENGIYKCEIHSDKLFSFVYGKTFIIYRIEDNNVILMYIEPKNFFLEGHSLELDTYKGVPIVSPKDKFKVDVYLHLNKK